MKEQQEITVKETFMGAIVPAFLIIGTKLTSELGYIFFPEGIPFYIAALIWAFNIAAGFRLTYVVVQCFIPAYKALNSAIMVVRKSSLWIMLVKATKSLWLAWLNTDISSRKLMVMIAIIGLSLALFTITQRFVDLWLPPIYSAVALSFAYLFEKECPSRKQNIRRYWLSVVLIFCIICLIGISMTTIFYLGDADTWSEIWELMARLPIARSGTVADIHILTAMSLIYYISKQIYQRYEMWIMSYVECAKTLITDLVRGLSRDRNSLNAIVA